MRRAWIHSPAIVVTVSALTSLTMIGNTPNIPTPDPTRLTLDAKALVVEHAQATSLDTHRLLLRFNKADQSAVTFRPPQAYASKDWSTYGGIRFDLRNPTEQPIDLCFRIDDAPDSDGARNCEYAYARLEGGEQATLLLPMAAAAAGMKAGPPVSGEQGARVLALFGPKLDLRNIEQFRIFLVRPDGPRAVEITGIQLQPRSTLTHIVDRYGQYVQGDWPGKVNTDEELRRNAAAEEAWLTHHLPAEDRDNYGGWRMGPALTATGFFRTALVLNHEEISPPSAGQTMPAGARWWLVTPDGRLFWSAGITCIYPNSAGPVGGRENMFTWLPEEARRTGMADFYQENLQRKFGRNADAEWTRITLARLWAWGFNTIGNWSSPDLWRTRQFPFTVPVHYAPPPYISGTNLADYFDPKFPQIVKDAITQAAAEWMYEPWCLGFFVDNEVDWGAWHTDLNIPRTLLAAAADMPARQALIALLRQKYDSPQAWGAAWGITVEDWDKPVTLPTVDALKPAAVSDCEAFFVSLAERYYSVVSLAMKESAPHHLYLGSRFGVAPKAIVEVAAKYCDVVSLNVYDRRIDTPKWAYLQKLGKPVIIGEFHFGATDRGLFHPGLSPRMDQAGRAEGYREYVTAAAGNPAVVGAHWFQYIDQPLTGRFDGENYNAGFVSITDQPYPELRDAARATNLRLYAAVSGATPPVALK